MLRQGSPNYKHMTSDHTHLSQGDGKERGAGRRKRKQGRSKEPHGKKIIIINWTLKKKISMDQKTAQFLTDS